MLSLEQAQALIKTHGGRLSGSRGYGTPRPDSDWDYWMSEREVKRLAKRLTAMGQHWDSVFLGSISFWTTDKHLVELSYLFPRNQRAYDSCVDVFA